MGVGGVLETDGVAEEVPVDVYGVSFSGTGVRENGGIESSYEGHKLRSLPPLTLSVPRLIGNVVDVAYQELCLGILVSDAVEQAGVPGLPFAKPGLREGTQVGYAGE